MPGEVSTLTTGDDPSFLEPDDFDQGNRATPLHEQVLREQRIFQEKINRVNKRKEWLRSNELLLRTFLSYCSLHGASAGIYFISFFNHNSLGHKYLDKEVSSSLINQFKIRLKKFQSILFINCLYPSK